MANDAAVPNTGNANKARVKSSGKQPAAKRKRSKKSKKTSGNEDGGGDGNDTKPKVPRVKWTVGLAKLLMELR